MLQHIIKRKGRQELFDERKVYASCFAAALNGHLSKEDAERLAEDVTNEIKSWISLKPEVSSEELFSKTIEFLNKKNPEIGFLYEAHRDIS